MAKILFTCLAVLVLITGCIKDRPTTQPVPDYPDSVYFKAEGTGKSEPEARGQALAEMSRIFESEVFSNTYDRAVEIIDSTGNGASRGNMESYIRVVSSVKLEGARIGRTWFDNERGTYRALAVLDRHQAGENWQGEIKDIDNKIEGEYMALDAGNSKFMKLQSLMKILDLWVERESRVSRLRVIGLNYTSVGSYDIKRAFYMVPQIKADLLVFLKITGEHANEMEGILSAALNKAGFKLSDERNKADVLITGNIEAGPVDLKKPGWEFARARLSLTIMDAVTGSIAGELSENERAGQLTYPEAVHKAVNKIAETASDKLLEYFQ
ncbi:MAG: LPP20 family lipoprotein [Nitrospirae bacterium]|nr:LPP20 family lipoprotein [Nitrospirota bacterium]